MKTGESVGKKLEGSGQAQGPAQFFSDSFGHPRPSFFSGLLLPGRGPGAGRRANKPLLYTNDSEGKCTRIGCPNVASLARRGKGVCEKKLAGCPKRSPK